MPLSRVDKTKHPIPSGVSGDSFSGGVGCPKASPLPVRFRRLTSTVERLRVVAHDEDPHGRSSPLGAADLAQRNPESGKGCQHDISSGRGPRHQRQLDLRVVHATRRPQECEHGNMAAAVLRQPAVVGRAGVAGKARRFVFAERPLLNFRGRS